mmetsp:Transcript_92471/g.245604  ORF Transcript_92471/g.245604 Transcript_92471/m.245604 type:complete len:404 (+) Transcript_92471:482-1693(+)
MLAATDSEVRPAAGKVEVGEPGLRHGGGYSTRKQRRRGNPSSETLPDCRDQGLHEAPSQDGLLVRWPAVLLEKRRKVEPAAVHLVGAPGRVQQQLPADAARLEGVPVAAALLRHSQVLEVTLDIVLTGHYLANVGIWQPAFSAQPLGVPQQVPEACFAHAVAEIAATVDLLPSPRAGLRQVPARREALQLLPLPGVLLADLPVHIIHQQLNALDELSAVPVYGGGLAHAQLVLLANMEELLEDALAHGSLTRKQGVELVLEHCVGVGVVGQGNLVQVPRQARNAQHWTHCVEEPDEFGVPLHDSPSKALRVSDPDVEEGHHRLGGELHLCKLQAGDGNAVLWRLRGHIVLVKGGGEERQARGVRLQVADRRLALLLRSCPHHGSHHPNIGRPPKCRKALSRTP